MASSNGQVKAPVAKAEVMGEIGASGLSIQAGRPQDEFHRHLRGDRATRTYREMSDNDPVIGAILAAIDLALRKTEWPVEPADESPEAAQEADFVVSCLSDLNVPWSQTVSAILSMLPHGWAYLETVYKIRGGDTADPTRRSAFDDGRIGWRKHALRAQESRVRWEWDSNGGIAGMVQRVADARREVTIPIQKALLFRTTSARSNPEGRSVLRNAYRPWYFKKRIEEIEGIGIERDLAGLPVALVPPEYLANSATAEMKQVLEVVKRIIRDIKRDEQEGIIFPKMLDPDSGADLWELKLMTTGGRRQFDTDAIIARYDQRIAMTTLADFILLGHEKVGSMALGVSKVEMFNASLTAYADEVADVMNLYAVPRLWALNGLRREVMPKITHGPVAPIDIDALGEYIHRIAGAGVVVDDALEDALRDAADLPARATESIEA